MILNMTRANFLIGFDFGINNIGVAIGQTITQTSQPLSSIKSIKGIPNWKIIENLIKAWNPQTIIVGLPLNMDGSMQNIAVRAKYFAQELRKKFFIPVNMQDERLTTIEAKSILFDLKGYRGLKKSLINAQSAAIILNSWIHKNK
ncbi:MAG: Holliday junction resolvase RuvX [Wigglesworthia glossinidia]|nr:Holliday junction resolvase RuvX [Wigglesworthia glossinidia]